MRDIILNEAAKASDLLAGKAKMEDVRSAISLIARYDIQAAGIKPESAAGHARQVVRKLFPQLPPKYVDRYVEYYVAHAADYPLSKVDGVPITQTELDAVNSCAGIRCKCLAFTLLALAKLDTVRHPDVNYWVSGDRWNEIQRRANLTLSEDDMCYMIHDMYAAGLIGLSERVDNCSMHVLFADAGGEAVMTLQEADYKDLGYCFRAYVGEKYIRCGECGRWIKQAANGRKRFCSDCAGANHNKVALASYHRHK